MKEYSEVLDLKSIWKYFEGFPLVHLATIDDKQPRVRPMALITYDNELWLATKSEWDKVGQIRENNCVEFTIAPTSKEGTGSIRATATARIVNDKTAREKLALAIPWFNQYWSSTDDANFTLLHLELSRVLFDHPSDRKKYTISLT